MTLSRMPEPDRAVLDRSGAIIKDLEALIGVDGVISDEDGRRAFETDALTAYRQMPLAVVLPRSTEEVSAVLKYCHQNGLKVVPRGAGTSLCGGALPPEDCDRHRHLAHEPRARGRLRQPHRPRRGRHHQSRHHRRRVGRGLLLRARSVEPARLHDRRQHRHELGRRALPEVRRHDQQRARRQDGADGRRDRRDRRRRISMRRATTCSASSSARRASSASSPRRRCASCARPKARGPMLLGFDSQRGGRRSASPPSSAPASSRSRSSSWTGRRSTSARPSPRPAIRSTSRRC